MVFAVDALSLHESPQALDQVQIGRIRREEQKANAQLGGQALDDLVALVAGVVQDDGDRAVQLLGGNLAEQLAHRLGVDHGRVGHGDQLPRDGVPSPQDIEPLPTGSGTHEDAGEAPQTTQESAVNEMSSVDEEDVALALLGGVEGGPEFGRQELPLIGNMLGMEGFSSLECSFPKDRVFLHRERSGNLVALKVPAEAEVGALRERFGI